MGLYSDRLEFAAEPPSSAELASYLREQVGDDRGIESYVVEGRRAELYCLLDPITRPYALAFLTARGGTLVDRRTGAALTVSLPGHVRTPWRALSWWRRFRIVVAYHRALWLGPRRSSP